ncbi:MAG: matrixin family metalloprotease [Patescibacteria group bacterium]|nr:matrixin family metalloprotease [Patescibacteria group bacterium]
MEKKIFALVVTASFLFLGISALAAKPDFSDEDSFNLPSSAIKIKDGVYSLGKAYDPETNKLVEGYAFVRFQKNIKKNTIPDSTTISLCYGFLAEGAKWTTEENWLLNPKNRRGLSNNFLLNNTTFNISKWENAADGTLDDSSINILGNGTLTSLKLKADTARPDNKNEVYFANVSYPGAIAVTIIWGVFDGPIENRVLVEWDQIYDDRDYNWSSTGEAGKMDFENIATHELGHSVGLDDQYDSTCGEVTMYGYAGYGEINKRTLETPDVLGISTLY